MSFFSLFDLLLFLSIFAAGQLRSVRSVQNIFAFLTYQTHIILFTRESLGLLVLLGFDITALTPVAYLRHRL